MVSALRILVLCLFVKWLCKNAGYISYKHTHTEVFSEVKNEVMILYLTN